MSAALACWVAQCQDLVDYFRWKRAVGTGAVRFARWSDEGGWPSGGPDDLVTMLTVMGVRLGV